jgi:hypothetical protein
MALPAPNSPVKICNLALSLLKQGVVTNIDVPTTDNESLCKLHYPQQRRATLRSHPWNFAIKRVEIAASSTAPIFGLSTAYDLPTDFIRFLTRHDALGARQGTFIEGVDYQIEDGQFLTGATVSTDGALRMRYIFDQESILKWDPLAIDLLVLNLALKLAPNFKSSPRATQNIKDQLRELKAEAKAIDGQERPPVRVQHSKGLWARRNRSSNVAGKYTSFE